MTLRILMATPRYAPQVGGVQRCVQEVSRRLAATGCEVTVLTTDRTGSLPADDEAEGVSIKRVRAWPAGRDYYFAPGIVPVVSRGEWDIVHVQSYHTFVAPLAMAAALRRGLPYVVTFHGGGHSSRLRARARPAQIAALAPLLRRADRLVATARFEVDAFGRSLGLPPDRFVLIPNGGDLPRRRTAPFAAPKDTTTIASVGRLERYKGHHRIIAALPQIARRRPDVRLWIAGSGSYEPALRELAARLGVAHLVTIEAVPSGDTEAMTTHLEQAALVVLLSEYETHPMAVLEAATLGRPLLLADIPSLRELVDDGVGRAIALHSKPDAVAAAVLEELERTVEPAPISLPTWDECADKHRELYESVLGRRA